ncbi:MAG: dienelactone hydrolase family protein [Phycisphaerae bacterium]
MIQIIGDIPKESSVLIPIDAGELNGALRVVSSATGVIIFAHGSGSSRHSSRNRRVASRLNAAGFDTLLFDLLTDAEEVADRQTAALRFNIPMLSERLVVAVEWAKTHPQLKGLPIGLFGASTGAAAAIYAAAERPDGVHALVSRGGRPDLAEDALPHVKAPTLLLVGGEDAPVLRMNEAACRKLTAPGQLRVVEGATHLFEEPGKLDEVADLAAAFFAQELNGIRH